ncbi:TetR/AcrR family transcriptional regulator [Pedobacter sp. 22226]|uniref:TetR/AcrR family transcriptional regulator n=1 Tax=Pedobacter sp. 22226 TaxID=3453894 RepID=UPI003F8249B1
MDQKERILAAGIDLFSTRSYHQTGIREITKQVEMPTGSFHYYFKNKEDFSAEVLNHFFKTEILPSFSEITRNPVLNPKQKIMAYFSSRINRYTKSSTDSDTMWSCIMGNLGQDVAAQSEIIAAQLQKLTSDHLVPGLQKLIEQGQKEASIKCTIDAKVLASMIFNTYEGSMIQRKIERNDQPLRQFLNFIENLL